MPDNPQTQDIRNKSIVIFAETVLDRELLKNSVARRGLKVFCFENELTCIDNLEAIDPDVIVIKAHTKKIIRRFVFALQAYQLSCLVLAAALIEKFEQQLSDEIGITPLPISVFRSFGEMHKILDSYYDSGRVQNMPTGSQDPVLFGSHPDIKHIRSILPTIIGNNSPILIYGEPGVGKELLVRRIFNHLGPEAVIVKVDCSGISLETIDLKGFFIRRIQEKYTDFFDQTRSKPNPLVLYLDRIERLDRKIQSKLLLVFDDYLRDFFDTFQHSDRRIRIIATTNHTPSSFIKTYPVRPDVYHRLNVIPLHIPSIRDRREDIPVLIDYYIIYSCADLRSNLMALSAEVQKRFSLYDWPRNLKELQSMICRIVHDRDESVVLKDDIFPVSAQSEAELFDFQLSSAPMPETPEIENFMSTAKDISLKNICSVFASRIEKNLIEKALDKTNWNRKKAAALLNISYKSMLNKLKIYEIV